MAYQGSCPDMCPESERQSRFGLYMSIFEKDENNQPDERAMVKEYRRSGADQEEPASVDLRTPRALELTMDYLVCNILDDSRSKTQELALEWYDFLWDRLRAIRKDITQQNMCDQASAILVERCARFHVHSCYAMNLVKNFDVDMNKRNLNDCLQMLRQMYHDLKITGLRCPGELEFQMYDILLHLNEDHLSSIVLMKTSDYRDSNDMKLITQIFNAYTNNQYYKFFHLLETADYMTSCILSLYANRMRLLGLRTIIYAGPPRLTNLYPAQEVIKSLGFDDFDDLKSFVSTLEIELQQKEDGKHYLVLNRDIIPALRGSESLIGPFRSRRLIENKAQGKLVGQLIDGRKELPHNPLGETILSNNSQTFNLNEHDLHSENFLDDIQSEPVKMTVDRFSWKRQEPSVMDTTDIINCPVMDTIIYETPIDVAISPTESPASNLMDTVEIPVEEEEPKRSSIILVQPDTEQQSIDQDSRSTKKVLANGKHDSMQMLSETQLGRFKFKRKRDDDEITTKKRPVNGHDESLQELHQRTYTLNNQQSFDVGHDFHSESSSVSVKSEPVKMIEVHPPSKNCEFSVFDTDEMPEQNELTNFEEPLELLSVLYRRDRYKRDQIADMMPVGRYKVQSLAKKLPVLKPPPASVTQTQSPFCKSTNSPQKSINSIAAGIEDEAKANVIFSHFIQEFDNNINT